MTPTSASELNLPAISRYSAREQQLTSPAQLSDLRPSDWAYQALANLVERYGCGAGYPNAVFSGSRSLSRYEAAALVNACLDRIHDTNADLQRLNQEFQQDLAVLRGRTEGLKARSTALAAEAFSRTTKLQGQATFVVGANTFSGSAINRATNSVTWSPQPFRSDPGNPFPLPNGTSFNYDLQLSIDTSFTGKDLLRAILRAGNFGSSAFGGAPEPLAIGTLESAFEEPNGIHQVGIDKLYYQVPFGKGFTGTLGGRVGQEDMLAVWPSAYPADTILNLMTLNGAPAAYSKNLGPGGGIWWQQNGFSLSANYVAYDGALGNPGEGGLGTRYAGSSGSVQVAYQRQQWAVAAIWTTLQPDSNFVLAATPFTHSAIDYNQDALTQAFGLSGYWQPLQSGWAPSISLGWGLNHTSSSSPQAAGSLSISQSWMVGLQWTDVLRPGNEAGFAVGQPVFATALTGGVIPNDSTMVWEGWYKMQLSDAISVTPALLYISRPLGMATPSGQTFRQFGGLIKTSLRF